MEADESSEDEPNSQIQHEQLTLVSSTFHNPEDLVQFVIKGLFAKGLKKGLFFAPGKAQWAKKNS